MMVDSGLKSGKSGGFEAIMRVLIGALHRIGRFCKFKKMPQFLDAGKMRFRIVANDMEDLVAEGVVQMRIPVASAPMWLADCQKITLQIDGDMEIIELICLTHKGVAQLLWQRERFLAAAIQTKMILMEAPPSAKRNDAVRILHGAIAVGKSGPKIIDDLIWTIGKGRGNVGEFTADGGKGRF